MPRECPPAFRSARAVAGIDSAKSPFDHPAPSPQSAAMPGVALRKERGDASVAQTLPD